MANRFVLNETSYHGKGAIESIPEEAKARGFKKALVCSDPDLVKFGVTAKVTDLLDKAGLAYELYSNIKPNPTIENVQQKQEAHGCDVTYTTNAEIKIMKENGFGRIVNTTSGAGLLGVKGNSIYCAAKHGVVGITKAAALDYATSNITINAIAPGTIETELVNSLKEIAPEAYKQAEESNPAGHLGKPEDIANAALFLCEDTSSFINGVILPVDSGCVAGK